MIKKFLLLSGLVFLLLQSDLKAQIVSEDDEIERTDRNKSCGWANF